jgi:Histidine kinase-, DNA gyrase B-, and HSP90-like ATPase/His Kinase A (phospho-acceptor) domain
MTAQPPFLAEPIRARLSPELRLLTADPQIWQLHRIAGGRDEDALATAGLALLAAKAVKTRLPMESAVRAVDEEGDIELWAYAILVGDAVELTVTGWRDLATSREAFVKPLTVDSVSRSSDILIIDGQLRLVTLPDALAFSTVGAHIGSVLVLTASEDGAVPVLDALTERRPIKQLSVSVVGRAGNYLLTLIPSSSADGQFSGFTGHLTQVVQKNDSGDRANDLPMGRQLASVIKQPLSRIVANAETIGGRMHGDLRENYAEYAQDIANAARHLSELVSDMEDLEAIDRAGFTVARDRLELGDLARRVKGLLSLKASDHGIVLHAPDAAETVEAIGEFRRVLQILLNLVGNAIRYAPAGSSVTIQIGRQGADATISVSDQGDGIAPADRERVFEKFERLGRSGDGGSGLGLYISRRLARAMGGELGIGEAPSGGATFTLTLPAR